MKYLTNDYQKVYAHKGYNICVLKTADPANGDSMGYIIDDTAFVDTYNDLSSAIAAIDQKLEKNI